MKTFSLLARLAGAVVFCLALETVRLAAASEAADANAASGVNTSAMTTVQQALRDYLIVQEQLHATKLALEQARLEAAATAKTNSEAIAAHLTLIEQSLSARHLNDLEAMQNSNRTALIVVGTVALAALFLMLFTAWLQLQSMQKFSDATATLRLPRALGSGGSVLSLGAGAATGNMDVPMQTGALEGALHRLQKRIDELEHSVTQPGVVEGSRALPLSAASGLVVADTMPNGTPPGPAAPEFSASKLLTGKGQTLLNLDRPQEALACFEAAIAADPTNAELLLKKGKTQECLQKLEEALASYEQAITLNQTLIMAYLLKAGVLNRLKRHAEALECYELALRHQPKIEESTPSAMLAS